MANGTVVQEEADDNAMRLDRSDVAMPAEEPQARAGSSDAGINDGARGTTLCLEDVRPSLALVLAYTQGREITEGNDAKPILVLGRIECGDFRVV
jgi:hypothetical protein